MLSLHFYALLRVQDLKEKIVLRKFVDDSQTSMEIVDPQKCSWKGKQHFKAGGIGNSFVVLLHGT